MKGTQRLHVWLSTVHSQRLVDLARESGLDLSALIRRLIDAEYDRRQAQAKAAAATEEALAPLRAMAATWYGRTDD